MLIFNKCSVPGPSLPTNRPQILRYALISFLNYRCIIRFIKHTTQCPRGVSSCPTAKENHVAYNVVASLQSSSR